MDPRQVFDEYGRRARRPVSRGTHCSVCGTRLEARADGPPVCPACGFTDFANPLPAVCVLVTQASSVVLCRRGAASVGAGKWCLPSGFIEYDEDFLTAGRREVMEETGLDVEIDRIVSVVSNFFTPDLHSLVIVMRAAVVGGVLQAGDDAVAAQWFDPSEYLPDLAFAADEHIIRRYFADPSVGTPVDLRFAVSG